MAPLIDALVGDIATMEVDAVVNAANHLLIGGGGVDAAIRETAGGQEVDAACRALGGREPGDAKATPGFALPARWIIHAVGPVWHGGAENEQETLASCYHRALAVADDLGAKSVAFPAISTGAFGFPEALAARVAVTALRTAVTAVRQVVLVAFEPTTKRLYDHYLDT